MNGTIMTIQSILFILSKPALQVVTPRYQRVTVTFAALPFQA